MLFRITCISGAGNRITCILGAGNRITCILGAGNAGPGSVTCNPVEWDYDTGNIFIIQLLSFQSKDSVAACGLWSCQAIFVACSVLGRLDTTGSPDWTVCVNAYTVHVVPV